MLFYLYNLKNFLNNKYLLNNKKFCRPTDTNIFRHVLCWWRWFNEWTVQLRTLPLVPSPIRSHPARGYSGDCMCIHVCLVWSNGLYNATSLASVPAVTHWQPSPIRLHLDMEKIAHMRLDSTTPTAYRTRVARLAVQCSTDLAIPSSMCHCTKNTHIFLLLNHAVCPLAMFEFWSTCTCKIWSLYRCFQNDHWHQAAKNTWMEGGAGNRTPDHS